MPAPSSGTARRCCSPGPARDVDLILVPHTCDALQGLGSVLLDFVKPPQPVLTLYHPRGRRQADRVFLEQELRRLGGACGTITGTSPSDADLHAAIDVEEDANERLARLCRIDRGGDGLSDRDVLHARPLARVPAGRGVRRARRRDARSARDGAAAAHCRATAHRPVRLMLGGIVPEPMSRVRRDQRDGRRRRGRRPGLRQPAAVPAHAQGPDPYARLAESLMSGPPDPTLGSPIAERADYLVGRMREPGAQGLLVYDVKFCEPELFDLPQLRDHLASQHLPMLHVEFEPAPAIAQQTLNRIEAFVEMLR